MSDSKVPNDTGSDPSPKKPQGTGPATNVCMFIGGGIGALIAFIQSSSALQSAPGGGGAAGSAGMFVNVTAIAVLGSIVGGIIGLIIDKATKE